MYYLEKKDYNIQGMVKFTYNDFLHSWEHDEFLETLISEIINLTNSNIISKSLIKKAHLFFSFWTTYLDQNQWEWVSIEDQNSGIILFYYLFLIYGGNFGFLILVKVYDNYKDMRESGYCSQIIIMMSSFKS